MSTSPTKDDTAGGSTPARGYQGRGGGRGGRGNRGRGGSGRTQQNAPRQQGSKFKGNTAEMNGHLFQCFDECSAKNEFARTVQALGEYVVKNLKQPGDMVSLTKSLTLPTIEVPDDLADDEESKFLIKVWEQQVTNYTNRLDLLKSNLRVVYTVIWGQCTEAMQFKLKTVPKFTEMDTACNCVWLLMEIKSVMQQFEGQRALHLALDEAKTRTTPLNRRTRLPLPRTWKRSWH